MTQIDNSLTRLGWSDAWSAKLDSARHGQPGRVTRAGRLLLVETEAGEILAECPSDVCMRPVCGDWVVVERFAGMREGGFQGRIRDTLPRSNAIERRSVGAECPQAIVANIDDIWIICGLDRSQGIRSLARYQALCRLDNVVVTVVLNKADTSRDLERDLAHARVKAPDLEVVVVSALTRDGLSQLESRLHDRHTLALLGPSGAGKSTLINALTEGCQQTHPVRETDRRGRHTTSAGQLLTTRTGALIIDTPGLRELGLWGSSGYRNSYADILELAEGCRFRDCTHDHEPGCSVRLALEHGLLAPERFIEYLELAREQATRAKLVKGRKRRYPPLP